MISQHSQNTPPIILAVGDDIFRAEIAYKLESLGYEVLQCSNDIEALEFAKLHSERIIIAEINVINTIIELSSYKSNIPMIGIVSEDNLEESNKSISTEAIKYIIRSKSITEDLIIGIESLYKDIILDKRLQSSKDKLLRKEEFERILINISTEFINADLSMLDISLTKLLCQAAEFMEADMAQVWLYSKDNETIVKAFEWSSDKFPKDENINSPFVIKDFFPYSHELLINGKVVKIENVNSLPPSAKEEFRHFLSINPRALLMVPIFNGNKLFATLSFESLGLPHLWHEEDMHLISIGAEIIKNALLRKSNEDEKLLNEEKFRILFENSYDGIFLVDNSGIIIKANQKFYEITGYSEAEVIGKYIWEFQYRMIPFEKRKFSLDEYKSKVQRKLYEDRNFGLFEYRISTGYGYDKYIEASTFAIGEKSETMISSIIRDITSKKILEAQLVKSKEQWEKTFDAVPDMIAILDRDYSYRKMNRLMKERFIDGFNNFMGQKCFLDIKQFDLQKEEDILARTEELFNEVYSDSDNRFYLVSQSPILDSQSTFEGSVMVARDITSIKKNEIYKDLITEVSERIITSHDLGEIYNLLPALLCNKFNLPYAGIEFYDFDSKEIINKGFYGVDKNEIGTFQKQRKEMLQYVITHGGVVLKNREQIREAFLGKNGELDIKSLAIAPILINKEIKGCIALADTKEYDDLTLEFQTINSIARLISLEIDRRLAQDNYKRLAKELEDRVEARTSQLEFAMSKLKTEIKVRMDTEERLILSKNEIAKAYEHEKQLHELKMRFISMISHEYRTPLTVIITSAFILERLTEEIDNIQLKSHILKIQKAVKNMTRLLEEVLLIGKFEAGQTKVVPSEIDIAELSDEIIEEITFIYDSSHSINFNLIGDYELIKTDEKLLKQIISNLLLNAVKYSKDDKKVDFIIECNEFDMNLTIRDYGIGIDEQEIKHIFDAFYRGNNVGNIPGTGLGLAITKKCVELLKGKIYLYSQINKGTTFEVKLPKFAFS